MRERPILFSAPMVRALLAGTKTQTRRIVRLPKQHTWGSDYPGQIIYLAEVMAHSNGFPVDELECPHGKPGDRLWVRESLRQWSKDPELMAYAADDRNVGDFHELNWPSRCGDTIKKSVPSIHLPRAWSRITREITGVRVERLQDISIEDAKAEGAWGPDASVVGAVAQYFDIDVLAANPYLAFRMLWEQINGPGSWAANPWVWAVEFRRMA